MSLLKASKDLREILAFIETRLDIFKPSNNVDFLITFDAGKWVLYDIIKGDGFR